MSSSVIPATTPVSWTAVPNGTAALPSFSFQNSQGTGIYRVSADVLGISTAGVQRVVVDASGNVGVGTASPGYKLEVLGSGVGNNAVQALAQLRSSSDALSNSVEMLFTPLISGQTRTAIGGIRESATSNAALYFATNNTERARIDSSGNLLVGTASSAITNSRMTVASGAGTEVVLGNSSETSLTNYSTTVAKLYVARGNVTLRSINAAGTVNASGADYAEYMTKAGDFTIAKGDICGVNSEGKLTKTFSEAVAFMVKSTNPSYVGGDNWGSDFEAGSEELEAARQLVDRIAFCGQVPVNVLGATPGQWIIPVEDNGEIKGEAVSNPSFEQYQKAVGKVIAIEEDGRARIIVKVA